MIRISSHLRKLENQLTIRLYKRNDKAKTVSFFTTFIKIDTILERDIKYSTKTPFH